MAEFLHEAGFGLVTDFSDPARAARDIEEYVKSISIDKEAQRVRSFAVKEIEWRRIAERYLAFFIRSKSLTKATPTDSQE